MRTIAFWLSVILIFIIPWEGIRIGAIGSVARVAGFGVAAFWIITVIATGKIRQPHPFHLVVALFLLWNVSSLLWSIEEALTIRRLRTYAQLAIMMWLIWDLYTTSDRLRIGMQAYVLGAYVSVFSTINNYLVGTTTGRGDIRYAGFAFNENVVALIMTLAVPMAWYLAFSTVGNSKTERFLKVINFAYLAPAIFAILLTASRTPLFAMIPAFLFILGSFPRIKPITRVVVAVLLVGALYVLQPLIPQSSVERLSTAGSEVSEGTLGGRVETWNQGIDVFLENPILGIGAGAFRRSIEREKVAHSTYVSVLTETGLVGFILFAVMLIMTVRQTRMLPTEWEARVWLTIFLVWAIGVSTMTWEVRKPTWLILSLITAGVGQMSYLAETRMGFKPLSPNLPISQ
jgi:O-antigen ligase